MVEVRRATPEDEPLLVRLNRHVQQLHLDAEPRLYRATDDEAVAAFFGALLGETSTRAFIAEVDGEPVGYLLGLLRERPDNPFGRARRWFEIDQISVDPAHQQHGVGRALVEAALATARQAGVEQVDTVVRGFNEASQAFFARLGFGVSSLRLQRDVTSGRDPCPSD